MSQLFYDNTKQFHEQYKESHMAGIRTRSQRVLAVMPYAAIGNLNQQPLGSSDTQAPAFSL